MVEAVAQLPAPAPRTYCYLNVVFFFLRRQLKRQDATPAPVIHMEVCAQADPSTRH